MSTSVHCPGYRPADSSMAGRPLKTWATTVCFGANTVAVSLLSSFPVVVHYEARELTTAARSLQSARQSATSGLHPGWYENDRAYFKPAARHRRRH